MTKTMEIRHHYANCDVVLSVVKSCGTGQFGTGLCTVCFAQRRLSGVGGNYGLFKKKTKGAETRRSRHSLSRMFLV